MTRILFLCHGNICRSPMAEFVLLHLADQAGCAAELEVASAAVSREEIGNDVYPPARRTLSAHGVPFTHRAARQVTMDDLRYYDHIICADRSNILWLARLFGDQTERYADKISMMMTWAGEDRDVSDPWYTGDFDTAFADILAACRGLLTAIGKSNISPK